MMITTEHNELLARLHHRMPAIQGLEIWDTWLNPEAIKEEIQELLRPYPSEWLRDKGA